MRAQLWIQGVAGAGIALLAACSSSPTGLSEAGKQYVLLLAPSAATIEGGASVLLKASVIDVDGKTVHPSDLVWTSSDPAIADVGVGGLVSGIREGTTQIAATWRDARGTSQVSVVRAQKQQPTCPDFAVAGTALRGGEGLSGSCPKPKA
jgi:hypothetical protein